MAESRQRIQMNPFIIELTSATKRSKKALEGVINAIEKYNGACIKASATLKNDLNNCKKKLNQSPKSPQKK